MNCPKCGEPLRISKKDPAFGLCDHCRKKFRLPESTKATVSSEKKLLSKPANEITIDETTPVQKPSKPITDETKVMKAIQAIDAEAATETVTEAPIQHSTNAADMPQKKRTPQKKHAPQRKHAPQKKRPQKHPQSGYYTDDQYDDEPNQKKKKYGNIPPSKVRSSREDDMRAGYDELLSIENQKEGIGSKIFTIIIILIVLALIGSGIFYLYHRVSAGKASSTIDTSSNATVAESASNEEIIYSDEEIEVLI